MKTYRFTIFFRDIDYMTEEMSEALYEAGCDDCSPASSGGRAYAHFSREAESLETAVASAESNVQAAGYQVDHVQIGQQDIAANAAAAE